jgi:uncharacterized protein
MKRGKLRVEKADLEEMEFLRAADGDLDCSGFCSIGETVFDYDKGFLGGSLNTYMKEV